MGTSSNIIGAYELLLRTAVLQRPANAAACYGDDDDDGDMVMVMVWHYITDLWRPDAGGGWCVGAPA